MTDSVNPQRIERVQIRVDRVQVRLELLGNFSRRYAGSMQELLPGPCVPRMVRGNRLSVPGVAEPLPPMVVEP